MKRAFSIAFIAFMLMLLPLWVQAQSYDLPSVCAGTTERYGVKGFNGRSMFNWTIIDPNGNYLGPERYAVMARGDSVDIRWGADLPAGIYTIMVSERSDFGCFGQVIKQEVVLNTPDIFIPISTELEKSVGFCVNSVNPLELNPGSGFLNYLWQDGSTNQIYYTGEAGTYTVRLVSDYTYIAVNPDLTEQPMRTYSCTYDSIHVVKWSPPLLNIPSDTIIGPTDMLQISAYPLDTILQYPGLIYNWNTGEVSPEITVHGSELLNTPDGFQRLWITVSDEHGCKLTDTTIVHVGTIDNFRIPAAFTPNGDGFNDTWTVPAPDLETGFSLRDYIAEIDIKVFNRHGTLVWQNKGRPKSWDGRAFNGKPLPMDSYHYVIKVVFTGRTYDFKGTVTIVR